MTTTMIPAAKKIVNAFRTQTGHSTSQLSDEHLLEIISHYMVTGRVHEWPYMEENGVTEQDVWDAYAWWRLSGR